MPEPFLLDPLDPATRRDPYALYRRGRDEHPLWRHPTLPLVSLFRYEDVNAILRDSETWSTERPEAEALIRGMFGPEADAVLEEMTPTMLQRDGEDHTRLRSLVNQAFTPRLMRAREARMREIANQLLDEALERGTVDLVQALTYPLPMRVIAEIIGVPAEDSAQFKEWSDRLIAGAGLGFQPPTREQIEQQLAILRELRAYFAPLAERRRSEPRDDLLSGLVAAEHEGSRLSYREMLQMLVLLLVAGNETTTTLIGNMAVTLLEHPAELARLRRDPGLMPLAVDEILRFSSPVQLTARRAVRGVELHGEKIDGGSFAIVWIGSANRDEREFREPDRLDVGRRDNRHLAFGFGRHFCLGANLARMEARVAFSTLLERTRRYERTSQAPLPLHPNFAFRSYTSIPVRLEAA